MKETKSKIFNSAKAELMNVFDHQIDYIQTDDRILSPKNMLMIEDPGTSMQEWNQNINLNSYNSQMNSPKMGIQKGSMTSRDKVRIRNDVFNKKGSVFESKKSKSQNCRKINTNIKTLPLKIKLNSRGGKIYNEITHSKSISLSLKVPGIKNNRQIFLNHQNKVKMNQSKKRSHNYSYQNHSQITKKGEKTKQIDKGLNYDIIKEAVNNIQSKKDLKMQNGSLPFIYSNRMEVKNNPDNIWRLLNSCKLKLNDITIKIPENEKKIRKLQRLAIKNKYLKIPRHGSKLKKTKKKKVMYKNGHLWAQSGIYSIKPLYTCSSVKNKLESLCDK